MIQAERRDREHGDAVSVDQERIFIGTVARAAVLDHAQAARQNLVVDAMVEQDDAVRDVFLEALTGERALAALGGDDRGNAFALEPLKQPAQLGTQDAGGKRREQHFDGVDHDSLGADRIDGVIQTDE